MVPYETPSATQQQQTLQRSPKVAWTLIRVRLTEDASAAPCKSTRGGAGMEGEEGTRHLATGSRAIWVGKWVERGSRILGKLGAACTVCLWSSALHRATAGGPGS